MIGFEAGSQLLTFDARDAMTVSTYLVASRTIVNDALKDCSRRGEWMTDEQVGLHKELRGLIEGACADMKATVLHRLFQVFNGKGAFDIIDSPEYGEPLASLP